MSKDECPAGGRLIVGPELEDGSRPCIRRMPDHSIRMGHVQALKDGQSLSGDHEILKVTYDPQSEDYAVQTIYDPHDEASSSKGPAMVNSDAYRTGYDRIFGKVAVGLA